MFITFDSTNKQNMNSNDKFYIAYQNAMMDFFHHCNLKTINPEQSQAFLLTEEGKKLVAERIKFYLESI